MRIQDLYIKAIGTYLPDEKLTLEQAEDLGYAADDLIDEVLDMDYDYEYIRVAGDMPSVDMAVHAARESLKGSGGQADLFIYAPMFRQGPDGWSAAGYVLRELGLNEVAGHEVAQGANGILAALQAASGWLALSPGATALVATSLNAGSPYLDRCRSAGSKTILGDGAAAAVLGCDGGIARVDAINSVMFPRFEEMHRGLAPLFEENKLRSVVRATDRSREFTFKEDMNPLGLIKEISRMKTETAQRSLDEAGLKASDLARVIHPHVSPVVVDMSVIRPLGLSSEQATWDFGRTVGHIGAADYLLSLDHLLKAGELSAGDHVLMVGSSAGFNVSSAVLTITGDATQS
jgi:3-oxoacyl-[acyl-carrier-protein] synthase III